MPETIMGSHIRFLRLERAWSQEQLAEISGLSVRTIQRIEQGKAASLETLKALAASFQVPLSRFSQSEHPHEQEVPMPAVSHPDQIQPNWHRFKQNLLIFAVINAGLAALNLARDPHHPWFLYVLGGWGLALIVQAIRLKWPT